MYKSTNRRTTQNYEKQNEMLEMVKYSKNYEILRWCAEIFEGMVKAYFSNFISVLCHFQPHVVMFFTACSSISFLPILSDQTLDEVHARFYALFLYFYLV